jgi:pSer/pThr/pTyr-binding forkhead associated (FHA) protein
MAILAQLLDDVVIHQFQLKPEMTLGRKPGNDIVIDESSISSTHAKLILEPNSFFPEYLEAYIEDLSSTNGTFLNEQPVIGRQRLRHNDLIRFAWNKFKFLDESESQMERTVHMIKNGRGS